jgi:hypothetical protein
MAYRPSLTPERKRLFRVSYWVLWILFQCIPVVNAALLKSVGAAVANYLVVDLGVCLGAFSAVKMTLPERSLTRHPGARAAACSSALLARLGSLRSRWTAMRSGSPLLLWRSLVQRSRSPRSSGFDIASRLLERGASSAATLLLRRGKSGSAGFRRKQQRGYAQAAPRPECRIASKAAVGRYRRRDRRLTRGSTLAGSASPPWDYPTARTAGGIHDPSMIEGALSLGQ